MQAGGKQCIHASRWLFSCDLSVDFSICSRTNASALLFICFTHLSLDVFGVYQCFSLLFLFVLGVCFFGGVLGCVFFTPCSTYGPFPCQGGLSVTPRLPIQPQTGRTRPHTAFFHPNRATLPLPLHSHTAPHTPQRACWHSTSLRRRRATSFHRRDHVRGTGANHAVQTNPR